MPAFNPETDFTDLEKAEMQIFELKGWIGALCHTFFEDIAEEERSPDMARRLLYFRLENGQKIGDVIREGGYTQEFADKIQKMSDAQAKADNWVVR